MRYLTFLKSVHEQLAPQRYLEIGVRSGSSLAVSRCRSVGVDPLFKIDVELDCHVSLFRTTTDEYFARDNPLAPTGGQPFDMSFIDGLHLFEFALRDFIYAERHSSARGLIVFDDVLPRNNDEAARVRHTKAWTGDVFAVLEVLAKYRPELSVVPVGTEPTGLLLVMGLDPLDTTLADNYDAIVAEFRRADPQKVPAALLDRLSVVPPERVLAAGVLPLLAAMPPDVAAEHVRSVLAEPLRTSLGSAFVVAGA